MLFCYSTTSQHILDDSYGNASARVVCFQLNAKDKNMHGLYTKKLTELDDHQHLIVLDFTTWSLFWK